MVEQRSYYRTLRDNEDLCAFPRYDLAATTLGRIIQAVGRLIRGGVPFHGYFVDSAWAEQYLNRQGNRDEIESVCDRFLDAIENVPQNWQWEYISPDTLIEDINSSNGLSYQAIPSLLATLLHKQTITIQLKDREQKITWRQVQNGGSGKTGLHLVSQPFKVSFIETNTQDGTEKEKEGHIKKRKAISLRTQSLKLS